jgi:5-methylthioadenosine/S-adenosylhomocysteine deaminase
MVDYSVDMVEQMKSAILMQHVRHLDPTRLPAERTIEMATINGARALGLETEIGSLEPGKQADIAVFDLDKPYVGVLHRPITSFVTAGKGSDAKLVMVAGEAVYRDGHFPRLSETRTVLRDAERIASNVLAKARLTHRLEGTWRN